MSYRGLRYHEISLFFNIWNIWSIEIILFGKYIKWFFKNVKMKRNHISLKRLLHFYYSTPIHEMDWLQNYNVSFQDYILKVLKTRPTMAIGAEYWALYLES